MLVLNEERELVLQETPNGIYVPDGGKMEQVMAWRAGQSPDTSMMGAVRTLLDGIGEDPEREGLLDTPKRVAKMLREVTSGYSVDLDAVINGAMFEESYSEPIVVRNMTFYSMCEHHMLPFHGKAHVAYLPSGRVVGLSKIPRVVEIFARRLQVQERMTDQIANFLYEKLEPRGVAVVVEGVHFCAVMRGVGQPDGMMRTQAALAESDDLRRELLGLAGGER
ncbi:MAG: GTP cyclohydrolase I FolE [Anaerolineales bacterium]